MSPNVLFFKENRTVVNNFSIEHGPDRQGTPIPFIIVSGNGIALVVNIISVEQMAIFPLRER